MKRLFELRESRGWTQQVLADRSGVTRQAIAQYETGKRAPGGDILVRLSAALGVSSTYLLGISEDPTRQDNLPEEWVLLVEEALAEGLSPSEVRRAIQALKMLLGRDGGSKNDGGVRS